jgi:hypothetical protein
MVRKTMRLVLRKDLRPVDGDIEHAALARHDLRVDAELALDDGRQTGGLRPIVSTDTIRDGDVHTGTMIIRVRRKK